MNSFFRCNRGAGVSDAPVLQFTSAEHAVDPRRALDERAAMHAEVEAAYGGNPLVDQSNAILVMTPSEGFVAATRTKVTEQREVVDVDALLPPLAPDPIALLESSYYHRWSEEEGSSVDSPDTHFS